MRSRATRTRYRSALQPSRDAPSRGDGPSSHGGGMTIGPHRQHVGWIMTPLSTLEFTGGRLEARHGGTAGGEETNRLDQFSERAVEPETGANNAHRLQTGRLVTGNRGVNAAAQQ